MLDLRFHYGCAYSMQFTEFHLPTAETADGLVQETFVKWIHRLAV